MKGIWGSGVTLFDCGKDREEIIFRQRVGQTEGIGNFL